VTKRKVSVALLACLSVVMVILMAVPIGASAAPPTGVLSAQWSGAAFQGTDAFYGGTSVVAYKAGDNVSLTANVYNNEGVDITIREAEVKFDWGGVFPATTAPTQLRNGETGVFNFAFTLPGNDVATNGTLHSYQIIVGFQRQGTGYVNNFHAGELLGIGNGVNQNFFCGTTPVLSSSLKVSWVDPVAHTVTPKDSSTYTPDPLTGKITFGTAPGAGIQVYADYTSFENAGTGNGVNVVFYTGFAPVVNNSLSVYIGNGITGTFTVASGWTVDVETGKVTLASAPSAFETVCFAYENWVRMTPTAAAMGSNFAVYSADQAGAMASAQQYNSINANYPAYLFAPGTAAAKAQEEASVSAAKAGAEYKDGDFADAKTDYDAAVASLQTAINSDSTLNTTAETALLGLLSRGDNVVDAYAAKLNGQATMSKNIGVFYIMLGVATLLAGIGGIIWAFSQVIHARGPRQQI